MEQRSTLTSFKVLAPAFTQGALVAATDWVQLGDRVKVEDGSAYGNVTNSGTGVLYVGTDIHVGSIWSAGSVQLRDRVTVHGDVVSSALTKGNQVTILGTVSSQLPTGSDILGTPPTYPNTGGSVTLEPGQQKALAPGYYGPLVVKSGAKLRLREGNYSFASIGIEPQATLIAESNCSAVNIRNRGSFYFRGTVVEDGGDDPGVGVSVFHEGTQTAFVEAPFRGVFLAPKAELVLRNYIHRGQFLAKRVRVDAGATIRSVEPFPTTPGACGIAAPVEPSSTTPPGLPATNAPPLASVEDLDAFLTWYYAIPTAHLADAKAAISAVGSSTAMVTEIVERLENARADSKIGRVVMLLSLLGSMSAAGAEDYLLEVLEESMPNVADDPDGTTTQFSPFDYEIAYRTKAAQVLISRGTTEGLDAVLDVAKNHPVQELRRKAIGLLVFGKDAAAREALKAELQPADRPFVQRPSSSEPGDLGARIAAYQAQ